MRVFVAGATGVLGRRAVRELVAAGHQVTGVARSPDRAALLRGLGAEPVAVDLFDAAAVLAAAGRHDVICNLATHIPRTAASVRPSAWSENDRIRTEGAANLAAAAVAHGARYVQESIAFVYAHGGTEWIDEDAPLELPPSTRSVHDAEAAAAGVTEAGGVGVVLRFGLFYGTGSSHTDDFLAIAERGSAPMPGPADGHFPTVHLDDAARAVVAALDAGAGTYNVVDHEPLTRAGHAEALAAAVGRRRLWLPPAWTTRLAGEAAGHFTRSLRVSNARFREATGWSPRHTSPHEGWPAVVAERGGPRPLAGIWQLLALALLALTGLTAGLLAASTPRAFYDDFPLGRGWVAADGPYNEHLVRDVGGFFLALAVLAGVALALRSAAVVRTAGVAWAVFAVLHLVYHLRHAGALTDTFDRIASPATLALTAVAALFLAVRPVTARASRAVDRPPRPSTAPPPLRAG